MTEAQIQAQLIEWWQLAHKGLGVPDARLLLMVPNGAKFGRGTKTLRSGQEVPLAALQMASMKRQGLRLGVPDLFLAVPRVHHRLFSGGLWLEMKRPKRSKVSDEQTEIHGVFRRAGYAVSVAYSFDQAVDRIVDYLAGAPVAALPA